MSEDVITEPPIETPQRREVAVVPPSDPMGIIALAVANGVDADRLEKLMNLQERWERSIAEKAFNDAMARCQRAMPTTVVATQKNDHTQAMYADLADVARAMKPVYTLHGFSLSFGEEPAKKEQHVGIYCDVRHAAGHTVRSRGEFPMDGAGIKGVANMTALQAKGSTFTYGRRYLTLMAFDIAVGDNDGNAPPSGIDQDQADTLHQMFEVCIQEGTIRNPQKFMQWIGLDKFEDATPEQFEKARRELIRFSPSNGKNGGDK